MARLNIKIRLDPWVVPYLLLMDRLGLAGKAAVVVRDFVKDYGMRPIT